MGKALQFLLGGSLLGGGSYFIWWFYVNIEAADVNIKVALIGAVGVALAGIASHRQTRKREIQARHFGEKQLGFMQIIDLLFEMMVQVKAGRPMSEDDMVPKMIDFKKALMIWGSADLIATWNNYETEAAEQPDVQGSMILLEKVLLGIRKDLGHDDLTLKSGSLVGLMLVAEDKKLASKK